VETFIHWVENAQHIWDIIAKTPILYSLIHFIVSALVSIFAYKLFEGGLGFSQQYQTIEKILVLHRRLTQPIGSHNNKKKAFSSDECDKWFSYAIITGVTSASIIEVQFSGGAQVPWAVLYGLLGPYALRDILLSFLGKKEEKETKKVANTIFDKIESATEEKEFIQSLDGIIKSDIFKKYFEEIEAENAAEEEGFRNQIDGMINMFMEETEDGE
jgi:hypothetical protein